jgi:hypothetical protein
MHWAAASRQDHQGARSHLQAGTGRYAILRPYHPADLDGKGENSTHDPQGMREAVGVAPKSQVNERPYEVCDGADAVVLMTEWNQYRALDLTRQGLMKAPVFVDLRNVYGRRGCEAGFRYFGWGDWMIYNKNNLSILGKYRNELFNCSCNWYFDGSC